MSPERTIAHFRITAKLGQGGMGEVYRATDTKLHRDVALKILPEAFTNNRDRMSRFEREAQVLASLNHTNIAGIYGIEQAAIVMELVDGPMLAGPLALPTVLNYARQIAEGLEYAHERGVVHRDLKPTNIKITEDGVIKLLDFGLAKAIDEAPQPQTRTVDSPTLTVSATNVGAILGTAAYMSPEQAGGKPADRRSDIFSYGVVLYEMLTGVSPFARDSVGETLAAVLKDEPDWSKLPSGAPHALLARCLTKDRKQRLQAIGEARIALQNPVPRPEVVESSRPPRFGWLPWAVAAAVVAVSVWGWLPHPVEQRPAVRFVEQTAAAPGHIAVSPDGWKLAYIAGNQLYVRSLEDANPRAVDLRLQPDQSIQAISFSPDGEWIVYMEFAREGATVRRRIKKLRVGGGTPVELANFVVIGIPVLTWSANGLIYSNFPGGLGAIPSAGGQIQLVGALEPGESSYTSAQLLPDGQTLLCSVANKIAIIVAGNSKPQVLMKDGGPAWYAPSGPGRMGHVVYWRDGSLYAIPFDSKAHRLVGVAVPITQGVSSSGLSINMAMSGTGVLAYVEGEARQAPRSQLAWVNRKGEAQILPAPVQSYFGLHISPDGTKILVTLRERMGESTLSIWDSARQVLTQVSDAARSPVWAPDGKSIYFTTPTGDLAVLPADNSGSPKTFPDWKGNLNSISPDGKWAIGTRNERGAQQTALWVWPLADGAVAGPGHAYLDPQLGRSDPTFSTNGRWVAFSSIETGRSEVFVTPFLGSGSRMQLSNDGGAVPIWSQNGRELFYRIGSRVMAVEVEPSGDPLGAKAPRLLFEKLGSDERSYDVAADGRLLMANRVDRPAVEPKRLRIVMNWFDELRRLAPAK